MRNPHINPDHAAVLPCDCDGYHTWDELYDHRITLFIALCRVIDSPRLNKQTWRSKLHSDGTCLDGWFVLGLGKKTGKQITYHIPLERWDETWFAEIFETAPEYDGHTSDDVLERLKAL
jgi:hypothetical protein